MGAGYPPWEVSQENLLEPDEELEVQGLLRVRPCKAKGEQQSREPAGSSAAEWGADPGPAATTALVSVVHSWLLILTQTSKAALSSSIGSSRYFFFPPPVKNPLCRLQARPGWGRVGP